MPSTTFIIETKGDEVEARMINHNGVQYAPALVGVYTPSDLKTLVDRAVLTSKLVPDMKFHWKINKCKKHSDTRFECFGSDEIQTLNGAKIQTFGLYTTDSVEDGIAGILKRTQVSLALFINDKSLEIEMPYFSHLCATDFIVP